MFKTMMTVTSKVQPPDSDIQKIQPFIFCRWLSGNQATLQAANQLNMYYNIPVINQYNMIKTMLAGKKVYIQYPKNIKDDSKELEVIALHFKINLDKAKEYKSLMKPDEINTLMQDYAKIKGK